MGGVYCYMVVKFGLDRIKTFEVWLRRRIERIELTDKVSNWWVVVIAKENRKFKYNLKEKVKFDEMYYERERNINDFTWEHSEEGKETEGRGLNMVYNIKRGGWKTKEQVWSRNNWRQQQHSGPDSQQRIIE